MSAETTPSDTPAPRPPNEGPEASAPATADEKRGGLLLAVFWVWAILLAIVTVAQLAEIDWILNLLDVKRWFAR